MTALGGTLAAVDWHRLARLVAALLLVAGVASCALAFVAAPASYIAWDRGVLLEATGRFLGGANPYPTFQLAGPFTAGGVSNWTPTVLYPPPAFLLFAPFAFLPVLLWYAVPLGIIAAFVAWCRPRPWAVALIGLALCYPGTWTLLVWGNATMLVAALLAVGLRWPAVAPWVLVKPTLAPLALAGIRSRGWWAGLAVLGVVSALLWPLSGDWWTSTRNVTNNGLVYSLYQVPFAAIPLVAWAGRSGGWSWNGRGRSG